MFKRNRHIDTCPDVIHMKAVANRNAKLSASLTLGSMAILYFYGKMLEKQIDAEIVHLNRQMNDDRE